MIFSMHLRGTIEFLTFVLLLFGTLPSWAAPSTNLLPSQYKGPAPDEEIDSGSIRATRMIRDQTINLAVGLWSGPLEDKEPAFTTQLLSLNITSMNQDESSLEYGAHLTAKGNFGLHGRYKKYCCLGKWNEPYWTAGLGSLYKPSDLLVGFIKLSSYQIQVGGGFEDLFRRKRRWRLEGLIGQSTLGTSFLVQVGYAFDENSFLNF